MEKQVYSLMVCRNYFKWLNRLLLLFYSVIKSDLYVIMMNKLNCTIEIKCTLFINCRCITTRPRMNKLCLAMPLPTARATSSIFQVCFSRPFFFVTSECMNSFILLCQWYISNTRISVSLATATTSLPCFFMYWITVDTIRVSASPSLFRITLSSSSDLTCSFRLTDELENDIPSSFSLIILPISSVWSSSVWLLVL